MRNNKVISVKTNKGDVVCDIVNIVLDGDELNKLNVLKVSLSCQGIVDVYDTISFYVDNDKMILDTIYNLNDEQIYTYLYTMYMISIKYHVETYINNKLN